MIDILKDIMLSVGAITLVVLIEYTMFTFTDKGIEYLLTGKVGEGDYKFFVRTTPVICGLFLIMAITGTSAELIKYMNEHLVIVALIIVFPIWLTAGVYRLVILRVLDSISSKGLLKSLVKPRESKNNKEITAISKSVLSMTSSIMSKSGHYYTDYEDYFYLYVERRTSLGGTVIKALEQELPDKSILLSVSKVIYTYFPSYSRLVAQYTNLQNELQAMDKITVETRNHYVTTLRELSDEIDALLTEIVIAVIKEAKEKSEENLEVLSRATTVSNSEVIAHVTRDMEYFKQQKQSTNPHRD